MSYTVVSNGDGTESVYAEWVWVCAAHPTCPCRQFWDTGINPPDAPHDCGEGHPITKKAPR
jgi:hypothetical protein